MIPPHIPAPKKSLGQHFLAQTSYAKRIVALLNPASEDNILEIGPGPGALTRILQTAPHSQLLLLEKDRFWSREQGHHQPAKTTVINCDAMDFPWQKLGNMGAWKITGNLPYNVASPLIWDIVSRCGGHWLKAVFMVQKEVGERITAKHGTKNYGALSVWAQSFSKPRLEFIVGPQAFNPPPKVHSAVISFEPRTKRPANPQGLKTLLDKCFQKRRKQLGTIFRQDRNPRLLEALESLGLSATLRPEDLTCDQFDQLAESMAISVSK